MNHSDKPAFIELFHGLAEYYKKDKLSTIALKLTFAALEEYSLDQLSRAATAHIKTTGSGRFMPGASDLIQHLDGGVIKADEIIAAARLANTPLGVMARIQIKTWNLNNLNSFDLKPYAEEALQLLPKWKEQARIGQYTNHQISIMIKHGVDPLQPFHTGLAAPCGKEGLRAQIEHVTGTKRHAELLEPPYRDQATASTGSTQVAQIARSIGKLEN